MSKITKLNIIILLALFFLNFSCSSKNIKNNIIANEYPEENTNNLHFFATIGKNDLHDKAQKLGKSLYSFENGVLVEEIQDIDQRSTFLINNYLIYRHKTPDGNIMVIQMPDSTKIILPYPGVTPYTINVRYIVDNMAIVEIQETSSVSEKIVRYIYDIKEGQIVSINKMDLLSQSPWPLYQYTAQYYLFYQGIEDGFRTRKNIMLNIKDKRISVFNITPEGLWLLAESGSLPDLSAPELKNYKEPFITGNQLYLQDIGNGETTLLGKVSSHQSGGKIDGHNLIFYTAVSGINYLLNSVTLEIFSVEEKMRSLPCYGFEGGYWYEEEIENDRPMGENGQKDFTFVIKDNQSETMRPVLRIENYGEGRAYVIEHVYHSNGRLFISGFEYGLVYNIITGKVEEVYEANEYVDTFAGSYLDMYRDIVQVIPFGGKTFIFLRPSFFIRD